MTPRHPAVGLIPGTDLVVVRVTDLDQMVNHWTTVDIDVKYRLRAAMGQPKQPWRERRPRWNGMGMEPGI